MEPINAAQEISGVTPPAAPPTLRSFNFRQTFQAFTYRNYRLFFFGQLISLIGTWMNNTAEGWLVYQLTGSKTLLGIVAAASTAPMLVLSTLGGWMADRYPKRSILVVTQASGMLVSFALGFLVWSGSVQPWQLITLAALGGIILAFDMPARQAFVIEITSRKDLVNAISLNSAAFNGARIVGPSVAGLLMGQFGIAVCFFVDGFSFIAVIAGLLMMRLAPRAVPVRNESIFAGAVGGFRYIWESPRLLRIFSIFALVGVFGWSYSVLMPAIARDVLKVNEESYGILLGANGFGALCGALIVAALGHIISARKLALGGLWFFSVSIIFFAFTTTFWLALIFLAAAGLGLILFLSCANSAVQTSVKDDMRGRVMGVWSLVFGGAIPIGGLQAGTAAHYLGSPVTILIGAIICALGAVATLLHARREERS